MPKIINSDPIGKDKSKIAVAPVAVRGKILTDLSFHERKKLIESLIEDALVSGLYETKRIHEWLGAGEKIKFQTIDKAKEAVISRWVERSEKPDQMAKEERGRLIEAAKKIEFECAERAEEEQDNATFVRLKQLQLKAQERVAKLADVEKSTVDAEASLNIAVFGANSPDGPVTTSAERTDLT